MAAVAPEPITLEIIQSSLQATSDEMFAAFRKTAMSAIIYEVLDMGTAITDAARATSPRPAPASPRSSACSTRPSCGSSS